MIAPISSRFLPLAQSALRIAAGLTYWVHGAQKSLGWFGGFTTEGGPAYILSRWGAAGVIETLFGACIVLGYRTRFAAFIASGEMAVAYFWVHSMSNNSIWWWQNRGEVVLLFSFIFLTFAAWGGGPISLDALIGRDQKG